jgi:hypothetical protein
MPSLACALFLAWVVLVSGCASTDTPAPDGADGSTAPPGADGGEPTPPACTVTAPTACDDPDLAYADVKPIFERRCLGCHDGSLDLWPLTSYTHVASWSGEIRGVMRNCSMPPADSGVSMPVEERETILRWIRCGLPQ